jgi:Rv2525c-like, glycoside hydrolase-like domain
MQRSRLIVICFSLVLASTLLDAEAFAQSAPDSTKSAYLGFDLNTYPGDSALPVLRKSFVFTSYWLNAPPGAKANTWQGKRGAVQAQGFGFLVLYNGPLSRDVKSEVQAKTRAASDAARAASNAKAEGFSQGTTIFLDIEEGGRLTESYHAYLLRWIDELAKAGYRSGVYCSGMPVNEGQGVTIVTADDIRSHVGSRDVAYFVFNDACPAAPGCAVTKNPPAPSASGVGYAVVWQFAQSPRRKQYTTHCAAAYNADGNCYAPGDTAHAWFLDLDAATTADPSHGRQ